MEYLTIVYHTIMIISIPLSNYHNYKSVFPRYCLIEIFTDMASFYRERHRSSRHKVYRKFLLWMKLYLSLTQGL